MVPAPPGAEAPTCMHPPPEAPASPGVLRRHIIIMPVPGGS